VPSRRRGLDCHVCSAIWYNALSKMGLNSRTHVDDKPRPGPLWPGHCQVQIPFWSGLFS
jgi:hypothetical protein